MWQYTWMLTPITCSAMSPPASTTSQLARPLWQSFCTCPKTCSAGRSAATGSLPQAATGSRPCFSQHHTTERHCITKRKIPPDRQHHPLKGGGVPLRLPLVLMIHGVLQGHTKRRFRSRGKVKCTMILDVRTESVKSPPLSIVSWQRRAPCSEPLYTPIISGIWDLGLSTACKTVGFDTFCSVTARTCANSRRPWSVEAQTGYSSQKRNAKKRANHGAPCRELPPAAAGSSA